MKKLSMIPLLCALLALFSAAAYAHPILIIADGGDQEIPMIINNAEEVRKKHSIYNPGHFKENGKYAIMMTAQSTDTEWTEATFYFSPRKSGTIKLSLRGGYLQGETPWIVIHEVSVCEIVKGSDGENLLQNGSFKELENNMPVFWTPVKTPYMIQTGTFTGLAVSFPSFVFQELNVRENANMKLKVKFKTIF